MSISKFMPIPIAVAAYFTAKAFMPPTEVTEAEAPRRDDRPSNLYERMQVKLLVDMDDRIRGEVRIHRASIRSAFENREFAALEREADKLRLTSAKFADGRFKLENFYKGIAERPEESEEAFLEDFKRHKDWERAQPLSLTRRIALADTLINYAWHARGTGGADTVTEEAAKLFHDRLEAASQVLISANSVPGADPHWHVLALRSGRGLNLDARSMDFIVAKARKLHPAYWPVDCERAVSLLPRWHGQSGDWEAFAAAASELPGGAGDEVYTRVVLCLAPYFEDLFAESDADWSRIRKGFELMMERYPESMVIRSQAAKLGAMACDFAFAKDRFGEVGRYYHEGVWDDGDQFVIYRTAAKRGRW